MRARAFCIGAVALIFTACFITSLQAQEEQQNTDIKSWTKIDLSHTFANDMPTWPGAPGFALEGVETIEKAGYYINKLTAGEHVGTHIDAPSHFIEGGKNVDQVPLDNLIGPLVVIDVSREADIKPDLEIGESHILDWESRYGAIPDGAFVIINTGWWKKWNDPAAFINADKSGAMHFPGFGADAVKYLLQNRNVKGLGTDTMSTDRGISASFDEHHLWLGADRINIENLTNLDQVPPVGATLMIGAIKIASGSGAPARIFALLPPAP